MSAASSPVAPTSLSNIARVVLRIGCILIESGVTARRAQHAMQKAALGFGCRKIEMFFVSDHIVIELHRGEERLTELRHIHAHGVNMHLASVVLEAIERIDRHDLDVTGAQGEFDRLRESPSHHAPWLVCLAAGIACAAFGRLLGADWPAFLPTVVGSALGQWLRTRLSRASVNYFLSAAVVSFSAALLAGLGARLAGSQRPELALLSAVLLLIPGLAALNAHKDILDGYTGLGTSRTMRVLMTLLFISAGLLLAQRLLHLS